MDVSDLEMCIIIDIERNDLCFSFILSPLKTRCEMVCFMTNGILKSRKYKVDDRWVDNVGTKFI